MSSSPVPNIKTAKTAKRRTNAKPEYLRALIKFLEKEIITDEKKRSKGLSKRKASDCMEVLSKLPQGKVSELLEGPLARHLKEMWPSKRTNAFVPYVIYGQDYEVFEEGMLEHLGIVLKQDEKAFPAKRRGFKFEYGKSLYNEPKEADLKRVWRNPDGDLVLEFVRQYEIEVILDEDSDESHFKTKVERSKLMCRQYGEDVLLFCDDSDLSFARKLCDELNVFASSVGDWTAERFFMPSCDMIKHLEGEKEHFFDSDPAGDGVAGLAVTAKVKGGFPEDDMHYKVAKEGKIKKATYTFEVVHFDEWTERFKVTIVFNRKDWQVSFNGKVSRKAYNHALDILFSEKLDEA